MTDGNDERARGANETQLSQESPQELRKEN